MAALSACNNSSKQEGSDASNDSTKKMSEANVTYAYPVMFSKFEIGDPNNAKMLADLWKDFDNGNLSAHKDYFADHVELLLANSAPMIGPRDSVLSWAQNYRNGIAKVVSSVDALIPLNNLDSNYHYVAIWGLERDTWKDGKTDSTYLQEVWRLNKDNKFDWMAQYASKPPAPPAPKKK